jgi:hypothetical protein
MEGSLLLAPSGAHVAVRTMTVDRHWQAIAGLALIGYVFVGFVALAVGAAGAAGA